MAGLIRALEELMYKYGVKEVFQEFKPQVKHAICTYIDSDFTKDVYAPPKY